jgi:hypothetical protein
LIGSEGLGEFDSLIDGNFYWGFGPFGVTHFEQGDPENTKIYEPYTMKGPVVRQAIMLSRELAF